MKTVCAFLAISAAVLASATAHAEIPSDYNPFVVSPPFSFSDAKVDLTPAFTRARSERKDLLIYLGANDCPPCKLYSRFLDQNKADLKPAYGKFVVVDIRAWLRGPMVTFVIDAKDYEPDEFRSLIGDRKLKEKNQLRFPTWWIVSAEGKLIRTSVAFYATTSAQQHLDFLEGRQLN
jgi:thiol-disulfide isomerase/thioredoxin